MAECLTPAETEALLADTLPSEQKVRALDHVADCSKCRALVERYRSHNELLGRVQKLDRPKSAATDGGGEAEDATTPRSDSFPGYDITREIHRGGQGVVYQAIQRSTQRKVAIKVMKEGPFAGAADKARFELEIQLLGQLRHSHIVTIHDSGSSAGSFYFVMDYVSGQSLDAYMENHERPIKDTLKLFAKICDAINAAHLRGVVHRDVKPGNIRLDAEGEPRILDFGLAKVATGEVLGSRVMTMTGEFVGSLPWASPEQAEGIPSKIDIRTDVYSLGVILYQMLTGKFPYEVIGNIRDVLDRIMNAEPVRPSTLRRQIDDEVETLVLKCLSKERERRYQTAGELARDIGRYLAGEPIDAKRDSRWYILRKWARRYQVSVSIGVILVIAGFAFGATSATVFYRKAQETKAELNIYKELVEALSDAIMVIDPDTLNFIEANEAATLLLGYSREELLTMNLKETSNNPRGLERGERAPRGVGVRLLKRKDGSILPVEIHLERFDWEGRRQLVAVFRDLRAGQRPKYQQLTDELFDKWVFSADVIAVLEADPSLDSNTRRSAIAWVQAKGDAPDRLQDDARRLVRHPGGDPHTYSIARRAAEAAIDADPTNGVHLTALGMAQFRLERYDESLATLLRSDEMNGASEPADAAFLAMTYQRLGQTEQAMAAFRRLRDLIGRDEWKDHDEAHAFLREARSVVMGFDASRDVETPSGLSDPSSSPGSIDRD